VTFHGRSTRFSSGVYDGRNNGTAQCPLSRQRLHGVTVLAVLVQSQKTTQDHGFWAICSWRTYVFGGVLQASQALCHKTYVESNSAINVAIPLYTMSYGITH
jgi:hypothetical protein